jgi:hypothetical protein
MGWMTGIRLPARAGVFLFVNVSKPAVRPTQPPIQWEIWGRGGSIPGGKAVTCILVVPRLRMCGAIPPIPHTLARLMLNYIHTSLLRSMDS